MSRRTPADDIRARLVALNVRPFGRPEAAFYEFVAAAAVRDVVAPIFEQELRTATTGPVLDVGCGGGAIAARLAHGGRSVVGVDASIAQLRRLRRRHPALPAGVAAAEALPFASGLFAAVVSSCAVKHWPVRLDGLRECARVLRPGGVLVVVEIDGGEPGDLRRFAGMTRIPPGLRRLYPGLARRSFVPVSPTIESLVADVEAAGMREVRSCRVDGLPFLVVAGVRA